MKIIIEIPNQHYETYSKNIKLRNKNVTDPDMDLMIAAKIAVFRELNIFAAVYRNEIEVSTEK